ncbi:MAG: LacI family DNA-binding transcriptional regulator [Erysipelotrichaceae bacterium]|nr:LacI family DNA-binding transcriptional regulator [Erysipelotrichaceae bacterium]
MSPVTYDTKKKVTIYNVAHEAGVSLATVSRVINDSTVVKEETKVKVQNAILKLGYKPNAMAQGLALNKTTTIALIVPDSSILYIGKIFSGLLDVSKIYKYSVALYSYTVGIDEMSKIVDNIVKSRADGLIIYNDCLSEKDIATLESYQIPMVCLGNKVSSGSVSSVYIDYKQAVYDLTTKYLNAGISNIAVVEDRKNPNIISNILEGVQMAYTEHNQIFKGYVNIPETYHNSYEYLTEYFKQHHYQLVITYRDSQALAVINSCVDNGISIPEQTEVVCVMDSRYTEMVRPQISSFDFPAYDMGALAMRIMTKKLDGIEVVQKDYKLNYIYRPKNSTKI